MRSAFAGLSLPTIWNTMASVTSIASYFAYSFTSHIHAYAVHRISAASAPAVGRGGWRKAPPCWWVRSDRLFSGQTQHSERPDRKYGLGFHKIAEVAPGMAIHLLLIPSFMSRCVNGCSVCLSRCGLYLPANRRSWVRCWVSSIASLPHI